MKRREFALQAATALGGALGIALLSSDFAATSAERSTSAERHRPRANTAGSNAAYAGASHPRASAEQFLLRPPGARAASDFARLCIRCGLCVIACPHETLRLASAADARAANAPSPGTPVFAAAARPCYLCDDLPCVCACPTGALEPGATRERAAIGTAFVDASVCVAHFGIQCDACYRACPLIDSALRLDYRRNERTGKHALLVPAVDEAACVGCGCCEHACITEKSAITVVPKALARGRRNAHYVRGWVQGDDAHLSGANTEHSVDSARAVDYLNEGL